MLSKKMMKPLLLGSMLLATSMVDAHRAWVVPQETVLSGQNRWVSFDAAVSNDIFLANYNPGRFSALAVHAPDGSLLDVQNMHVGKYRTVFDVALEQEGTYRIFTASSGLRATWETEDGQRRVWPGRGQQYTPEGFAEHVPAKAKNRQVTHASRRMETFVTLGAPTTDVLNPTGQGLELSPITHPNDLFAGEKAQFQFLMDGKPAVGVEVSIIREGTRYRNNQEEISLVSDKKGQISIAWNGAGRYFLEAEYKDNKAKKPATVRTGGYVAVFEVLPD